jgi:hypothetical protein
MTSEKKNVGWFLLLFTLVFMEGISIGQEPKNQEKNMPTLADPNADTNSILTKEIAERFLEDSSSVELGRFKSITTQAVMVLAESEDYLDLGSLTDLPVDIAKQLGRSTAGITLRGLQELSPDAALALSENRGGFLDLKGLTKLSDEAAIAITKYKGLYLYLGGVTSMSDELAEALAMYQGTMIELSNLVDLSESAAEKFCKIHAFVVLPSLKSITVPVAESLSKLTDRVDLGLESMSEDVAAALAKNESFLNLSELGELSDAAAAALSKHRGDLSLTSLKSFPNTPGHLDLARKLIEEPSDLDFIRMTELSDEVAEVLGDLDGDLHFRKLPSLSPRVAKAFARKRRELLLFGVTSLSDEAAEELAIGKNKNIVLLSMTELSDRAAEAFVDFKGDLDLRGVTTMSERAADALARRTGKTHLNLNNLPESVREILSGPCSGGSYTTRSDLNRTPPWRVSPFRACQ